MFYGYVLVLPFFVLIHHSNPSQILSVGGGNVLHY
jgi:hypothetical protein